MKCILSLICSTVFLVLSILTPQISHSYTRYVSPEAKLVRWFIENPTDPQNAPLVDLDGDGVYAVQYVFAASGSLDIPLDDGEFEVIRSVFSAYQNVPGAALQFIEDSNRTAITDVQLANDGKNLIFWDEDGRTAGGDIPDDQIALTKLTLNPSTGELLDADIRFNAQDYTWVTQGADNITRMDIKTVAFHQIGRMIGLDTSFIDTASRSPNELRPVMYPLIQGSSLRTKLGLDDQAGVAAVYPGTDYHDFYKNISGTVLQSNGTSGVFGAHVTAIDINTGNPVVSALSGSGAAADSADGNLVVVNSGNYTLRGVPAGTYFIAVNAIQGGTAAPEQLKSSYSDLGTFDTQFDYEFYNPVDAADELPSRRSVVSVNPQDDSTIEGINVVTQTGSRLDFSKSKSVRVVLEHFRFPFYGQEYTGFYVHEDGLITFGSPFEDSTESLSELIADTPKIAVLWDDLAPGINGSFVRVVESANQIEIIYAGVPEFPSLGASTFSVTLQSSGKIELNYDVVSSLDDGLIGISPGGGVSNPEINLSSLRSALSFQVALPIYEQFTGTGDDNGDSGSNDAFDMDSGVLSFEPNGAGYTVLFDTDTVATPTPTPTITNKATPTPSPTPSLTPTPVNTGPRITLSPPNAELLLGESVIVNVTATDPDSAIVTFTDIPQGTGVFGTTTVVAPGVFTTTYTVTGTLDLAGSSSITIFASDGVTSDLGFFSVTVNVPPTPTPTFTPIVTPSPTGTATHTPEPNFKPMLSQPNPSQFALIVGEKKSVNLFASDADGDELTFSAEPAGLGEFVVTRNGMFYTGSYTFTALAGFEGEIPVTIIVSDEKAAAEQELQITVFATGTIPTLTPTQTPTATPTATATQTQTVPPPTPTVNLPPEIRLDPESAVIFEGESVLISLEIEEVNRDKLTRFDVQDPSRILTVQSQTFNDTSRRAAYLFEGRRDKAGTHTVRFISSDGVLTSTKTFTGTIVLRSTPTPTPVPQGDIVAAQGHGGQSFVHRRQMPGVNIALGSAFSGLPRRFADAILSSPTRAVYITTGDVDGDGLADIVTSFGPDMTGADAFPNQVIIRNAANKRVIGHSFNAFPHTSSASVNNPYGEVRTAVGKFVPGSELNQIAVAHGAGGNQVIRLYEYTGEPAPRGFRIVTQFNGLVAGAATGNQNGGLTLAAGDLTMDGFDELLVGQTNSETSRTVIQAIQFDADLNLQRSNTIGALPADFQGSGGVHLAVGDLDGDGVNEVVAASMGNPDGSQIGDIRVKNLAGILRPVVIRIFNRNIIQGFERVDRGVISLFSHEDNPSGALTVAVGDLVPGGGDELVFGTSALLNFDAENQSFAYTHQPPTAKVRVLRFLFDEDGAFERFESVIANNSGLFNAFVNSDGYTNGVYVGIRPFGLTSQ